MILPSTTRSVKSLRKETFAGITTPAKNAPNRACIPISSPINAENSECKKNGCNKRGLQRVVFEKIFSKLFK